MRTQTLPALDALLGEEGQNQSSPDIIEQGIDNLTPRIPEQDKNLAKAFLQTARDCGIQIIIGDNENDKVIIPPKAVMAEPSQKPNESLFILHIRNERDLLYLIRALWLAQKTCEEIGSLPFLVPHHITNYQASLSKVEDLQITNISLPLIAAQALNNAALGDFANPQALGELIRRTSEHMKRAFWLVGLEPIEIGKFEMRYKQKDEQENEQKGPTESVKPYKFSILFGVKFHIMGYETPTSFNFHVVPEEALTTTEQWNLVVGHIRSLRQSLPRRMEDRLPPLLIEVSLEELLDSWDLPVVYTGIASGTTGEEEGWIYGVQNLQAHIQKRKLFPELKILSQLKYILANDGEEKIRSLIRDQKYFIATAVNSSIQLTKTVPPDLREQLQSPDFKAKDIFKDEENKRYLENLREEQKAGFTTKKEEELLQAVEDLLKLEEVLDLLEALPSSIELLTQLRENGGNTYGLKSLRDLKDLPRPHFASLALTVAALHSTGIRKIHVIPFKPVRYLSHESSDASRQTPQKTQTAQDIEKATTDRLIRMAYMLSELVEGVDIFLAEDDVIGMGEVQIQLGDELNSQDPMIELLINAGAQSAKAFALAEQSPLFQLR